MAVARMDHMNTTSIVEPRRVRALDGLRGVAAVSVVFYHAILHSSRLHREVLATPISMLTDAYSVAVKLLLFALSGENAVLVFFALSGFVLKTSLDGADGPQAAVIARFVLARALRIYPALFFCMACFLVAAMVYAWLGWPGMPVPDTAAALWNATLIRITWHGPSTTLQGEVLAVPFILIVFYISKALGTGGMLCCVAFSFMFFGAPALIGNLPNMNAWLPAFFVGMLVADRRLKPLFSDMKNSSLLVLIATFLFLRILVDLDQGSAALAQIVLAGALVGAVRYASADLVPIRALNCRPVQFLGRISYSLYLFNVIGLFVAWSVTDRHEWYTRAPVFTGIAVAIFVTIICLPICQFSERVFERGGIALGRRISRHVMAQVGAPGISTIDS